MQTKTMAAPGSKLETRIAGLDWETLGEDLLDKGFATTPRLLDKAACRALRAGYSDDAIFRRRIVMASHGFGEGEYKYFAYPLPGVVQALRDALYPPLAGVANIWAERLRIDERFPPSHADYLRRCHRAGQERPTPLVLKYEAGGYNCLHRDLYGELYFPFQAAILLSAPGKDFSGGEFMLVENRPRMQSIGSVVPLQEGEAVIFAVNQRPRLGKRGYHRVSLRHGVSTVTRGERYTLGIIFHDAK